MTCGIPAPGSSEKFTITTLAPQEWFHIYSTENYPTKAGDFNQGWGDTRFAPIMQTDGSAIHTYYAASTIRCAMLESVLHDVVLRPAGFFEVDRLKHFHLVKIRIHDPIEVVSFHSLYLPKLGLDRTKLIDSVGACYPETRLWAEQAFAQMQTAQAIEYGSRRDDEGKCIMLFKQRFASPPFEIMLDEPLTKNEQPNFLALLRSLGISEI